MNKTSNISEIHQTARPITPDEMAAIPTKQLRDIAWDNLNEQNRRMARDMEPLPGIATFFVHLFAYAGWFVLGEYILSWFTGVEVKTSDHNSYAWTYWVSVAVVVIPLTYLVYHDYIRWFRMLIPARPAKATREQQLSDAQLFEDEGTVLIELEKRMTAGDKEAKEIFYYLDKFGKKVI